MQWTPVNIAAVVAGGALLFVIVVLLLVNRNRSMRLTTKTTTKTTSTLPEPDQPIPQLSVVKMAGCPACTHLMPVIKQLQQSGTNVKLIDGPTLGMQWHRDNGVTGYPTICITESVGTGGQIKLTKMYRGARTADAIKQWATAEGAA